MSDAGQFLGFRFRKRMTTTKEAFFFKGAFRMRLVFALVYAFSTSVASRLPDLGS